MTATLTDAGCALRLLLEPHVLTCAAGKVHRSSFKPRISHSAPGLCCFFRTDRCVPVHPSLDKRYTESTSGGPVGHAASSSYLRKEHDVSMFCSSLTGGRARTTKQQSRPLLSVIEGRFSHPAGVLRLVQHLISQKILSKSILARLLWLVCN